MPNHVTRRAGSRYEAEPKWAGIRLLDEMVDLAKTEEIQRDVWGIGDRDIVPASQLRAAAHAGGHVSGAFRGDQMIGFAYGLVATPHGRGMAGIGMHSHMVAVLAGGREHGVGRDLKWFQRSWCLQRGMKWITWTFDPLQARNANLNLRHLGAVSHDYLVDFYGPMPGRLGGGQPSDRLLALWLLDSEAVATRAKSHAEGRSAVPRRLDRGGNRLVEDEVWLLKSGDVLDHRLVGPEALSDSVTRRARDAITAMIEHCEDGTRPTARIAVPENVTQLLVDDPDLTDLWRMGVRAAMTTALVAGMMVTGFENTAYVLQGREEKQANTY